jgi:hypothetical protein
MEIVFNPYFARQPDSDVMVQRTLLIIDAARFAGKHFLFDQMRRTRSYPIRRMFFRWADRIFEAIGGIL